MLVFFRVLQGAAGGGLQPSEQSILADTFPPQKRSMAFAMYGVAVVTAPVLGPTVGGWIVDNYTWRWIFFLNIPVGIISLFLTNRLVEDPPYLAEIRKRKESIDYWGLGLLVVSIGALQVMLDKGQEDDWFGSRFIITLAVVAVVGLVLFFWRELSIEHPVLDLRLFGRRNVGMTQLVMFMVGVALYSSTVLIPQFLQEIMGYSARQAGMAVSSGGLVLMFLFPVAGALAPKFDPRRLVSIGFVITTFGLWRMTTINPNISFGQAVSWRVFIALGLPFLFIPDQYALLRRHSAGEIQRGQRTHRAHAQSRRQRRHQLRHHAAGAPQPEASRHALARHRRPATRASRPCSPASPAPGCTAAGRCPMPSITLARRSSAWLRCRPVCSPMSMSSGSWSR